MNAASQEITDSEFPDLATALDPERMAVIVEKILVPMGDAPEIVAAKITDVNYDPGVRCNLLFRFKVRKKNGGKNKKQMVTARLLKPGEPAPPEPSPEERRRFREAHEGLLPGPYFFVEEPRMVLCTFPYDSAMTWLPEALDLRAMKHRFSRLWAPEQCKAAKVKIDLLGYTPQMRASMHYEIRRRPNEGGSKETVELIGKTNAFKKTGKLFADSWALWESSGKAFPMPRPAGYLSAPRLTLQERVPGVRLGSIVQEPGFGDRVVETAEALAFLHRLRFPVNARRRARDEVKSLRRWGEVVSRIRSDLRSRVTPFVDRVSSEIESRTRVLCAVHADFHHTNVLVDGNRIRIIDFDEMSYGDPAVDVGRFLASLRIPNLRAYGNIHELDEERERFFEAYLRQNPSDASRIRLFETASLVTSAASAFRIQRPNWDEEVSLLLDEAERVFGLARRKSFSMRRSDDIPELTWTQRIRWAGDPAYIQSMVDRPVTDAYGVALDGCEVLRSAESRNAFRARFKLMGSRDGERWRSRVRLVVSKRKGGFTTHKLLDENYPVLDQHPGALRPPRPLAYLHRISASILESCQGAGLNAVEGIDSISAAMDRVGRTLAIWHKASTAGPDTELEPGHRRPLRQADRTPVEARAAKLMARARGRLPECEDHVVRLLHDVHLHEVVLDPEFVGLAGVHEVTHGDPRHDLAAMVAVWRVEGCARGDSASSAAAIDAFLRAYEEERGEPLESFAPFEALALSDRAFHLPKKTPGLDELLDLAEQLLKAG